MLMGVTDKLWESISAVIKMNDKVERLAEPSRVSKRRSRISLHA